MNQYTHDQGPLVHAHTIDENVDSRRSWTLASTAFTNRASELLKYYQRPTNRQCGPVA